MQPEPLLARGGLLLLFLLPLLNFDLKTFLSGPFLVVILNPNLLLGLHPFTSSKRTDPHIAIIATKDTATTVIIDRYMSIRYLTPIEPKALPSHSSRLKRTQRPKCLSPKTTM